MRARMRERRRRRRGDSVIGRESAERGCSLIEAVLALLLLSLVITGVAPVLLATVRTVDASRQEAATRSLAASRLEQMRALSFVWRDVFGTSERVSDSETNLAAEPPDGDGPGLGASGVDVLYSDSSGHADVLGAHGRLLPGASASDGFFLRRWSVERAPAMPDDLDRAARHRLDVRQRARRWPTNR